MHKVKCHKPKREKQYIYIYIYYRGDMPNARPQYIDRVTVNKFYQIFSTRRKNKNVPKPLKLFKC